MPKLFPRHIFSNGCILSWNSAINVQDSQTLKKSFSRNVFDYGQVYLSFQVFLIFCGSCHCLVDSWNYFHSGTTDPRHLNFLATLSSWPHTHVNNGAGFTIRSVSTLLKQRIKTPYTLAWLNTVQYSILQKILQMSKTILKYVILPRYGIVQASG